MSKRPSIKMACAWTRYARCPEMQQVPAEIKEAIRYAFYAGAREFIAAVNTGNAEEAKATIAEVLNYFGEAPTFEQERIQ